MIGPLVRVALVLLLLGLAGCGDDGGKEQVPTRPSAVPQSATVQSPPPAETGPADTTTTTGTEPDVGDEERTRVPAAFTIRGGGTSIEPQSITVPSYFPVELELTATGGAASVTFENGKSGLGSATLKDGNVVRLSVGSLKPGTYTVRANGGATASIRSVPGGDVGP